MVFEALDPARSLGSCPGVGVAKHSLRSDEPSRSPPGTGGVSANDLQKWKLYASPNSLITLNPIYHYMI